jgi:hypothetical protein
VASLAFSISVAASSYGLGRLCTGNSSPRDIGTLVVGLAVGVLITVVHVRRRHRSRADHAAT